MNIVFWLIVIAGAVAVWALLWPVFSSFGEFITEGLQVIKEELAEENYEQEDNK